MAPLFQLVPELAKIINFTVVHDPYGPVLVAHRLGTGVQVNDGQPSVSQTDTTEDVFAFPVRTAVRDAVHHLLDQIRRNIAAAPVIQFSANAAHMIESLVI